MNAYHNGDGQSIDVKNQRGTQYMSKKYMCNNTFPTYNATCNLYESNIDFFLSQFFVAIGICNYSYFQYNLGVFQVLILITCLT